MEIDTKQSLEISYSRWNRNHPATSETGRKINATVLHLATALISLQDNGADLVLKKAQSDFRLSDYQTEKLLSQAKLISDHAREMPDRLKKEIKSEPTKPATIKGLIPDSPGVPLDIFELTGKDLNTALSRLDKDERRIVVGHFVNGKSATEMGCKDLGATRNAVMKMRTTRFGKELHVPNEEELNEIKSDEEAEILFDSSPKNKNKPKPKKSTAPQTQKVTPPEVSQPEPPAPPITEAVVESRFPSYPDNTGSKPFWRETLGRRIIPEPSIKFIQTLPEKWNDEYTEAYLDSLKRGETFLLPSVRYPEALQLSAQTEALNSKLYLQTPSGTPQIWRFPRELGFSARPIEIVINKGFLPERYTQWIRKVLGVDAGLSDGNLIHILRNDQFNPLTILVTPAATSLFFRTRETKLVDPDTVVYPGPIGGLSDFLAAEQYGLAMYVKVRGEEKYRRILHI